MTDVIECCSAPGSSGPPQPSSSSIQPRGKSHAQKMRELYALPAPLRTFPLPTFIPHNPLSLFQLLYAWISQTLSSPTSHHDPLYQGWFSVESRSIHVTDTRAIRGLWEQGFYGKGVLSRSEPSWLAREEGRKVKKGKTTSEEHTGARRAERQKMKWERARREREAIDQTLSEEAMSVANEMPSMGGALLISKTLSAPPPKEASKSNESIAVQPWFRNSGSEAIAVSQTPESLTAARLEDHHAASEESYMPPIGPLELLALPNSSSMDGSVIAPINTRERKSEVNDIVQLKAPAQDVHVPMTASEDMMRNQVTELEGPEKVIIEQVELVGGSDTNEDTLDESVHSEGTLDTNPTPPDESTSTPKTKRAKSVRFSPTVEKNTFIRTEPPSSEQTVRGMTGSQQESQRIRDQEHLQLTLEETFFLSYALGALEVLDIETKLPIAVRDLFIICRQISYFPPRENPVLAPDDPFLLNYVVYHHFRSLGWVIRSGIKFSADYLLYNRGPVFTHAEFAVLILPSYSNVYWTSDPLRANYATSQQSRTWAWMSCINRVITQAKKSLILCYVDIPQPLDVAAEERLGVDGVLARYTIREFVIGRFVANRMRSSSGKERVK